MIVKTKIHTKYTTQRLYPNGGLNGKLITQTSLADKPDNIIAIKDSVWIR